MEVMCELMVMLRKLALVNHEITRPILQAKTGMDIVSKGEDLSQIVTVVDQRVSKYLLDSGLQEFKFKGVRNTYPGSFSEEDDSKARLNALKLWQIDPMDGTGDAKATYKTDHLIGPTTLVSLLERESIDEPFSTIGGIIFDIVSGTAIISDGKEIILYKFDEDNNLKEISYNRTQPDLNPNILRINKRITYPQYHFDEFCSLWLPEQDTQVVRVCVGGAGTLAMQFLRQYIEPTSDNGAFFKGLKPINIVANYQPDHKTWDLRPLEVMLKALDAPPIVDGFGSPLNQNEASPTLEDMYLTQGYVCAPSVELRNLITNQAKAFQAANPERSLTEKNY